MNLSFDQRQVITCLLKGHHKIVAIKYVRDQTNCYLLQAKNAVEAIEKEMNASITVEYDMGKAKSYPPHTTLEQIVSDSHYFGPIRNIY